jgi:hypothetical protein
MGKKMLVALMMEGKFSGEGIHSLESDDDLMSAMARELVERGHVGESAAAVWSDLKRERAQQIPTTTVSFLAPEPESGRVEDAGPLLSSPSSVVVDEERPLFSSPSAVDTSPALTLVHSVQKPRQKRSSLWPTGQEDGAQLLLFG